MGNRENKLSPVARESSVYSTVYKRKGIKGWWVGWYETGKRKAKALPTRKLAEHFSQLKYSQLNSDVFTGIVAIGWKQMVEEYRESKKEQVMPEDDR